MNVSSTVRGKKKIATFFVVLAWTDAYSSLWSKHPGQKVRSSSPGSTSQLWDKLMTQWEERAAVVAAACELRRDSSNSRSGDSADYAFSLQQEHQDRGQLGLLVFTKSVRWVWMTHLTKLSPTMCSIFPRNRLIRKTMQENATLFDATQHLMHFSSIFQHR